MSDLPSPVTESQLDTKEDLPNVSDLKIAWRYKDKQHESSEPGVTLFGHTYDLTKRIDKSIIDKNEINYWKPSSGMFRFKYVKIFFLTIPIGNNFRSVKLR